nr:hypothetical protein [Francisella persica]
MTTLIIIYRASVKDAINDLGKLDDVFHVEALDSSYTLEKSPLYVFVGFILTMAVLLIAVVVALDVLNNIQQYFN